MDHSLFCLSLCLNRVHHCDMSIEPIQFFNYMYMYATIHKRKSNKVKLELWVRSQRIPLHRTINYLPWIISLDLFWYRIIFFHAHPQAIYCSCVKFNQYWFICSEEDVLMRNKGQTDGQGDSYIVHNNFVCLGTVLLQHLRKM